MRSRRRTLTSAMAGGTSAASRSLRLSRVLGEPPDARIDSRVLELRLRIATALERWSLGEVLVNVLESGETVARFHHAYARALSLAGDGEASRVQIRAAVAAWSGIKLALVDDVKHEALWEERGSGRWRGSGTRLGC